MSTPTLDHERLARAYRAFVAERQSEDREAARRYIVEALDLPDDVDTRRAIDARLDALADGGDGEDGFDYDEISEQSFPCSDPPPPGPRT
ncbi:MAG TPA: hypothetical protein VFK80_03895 [Limnochordia bacterium]|nr:hypothetical protein [Limnochordia bacterium]